MRTAIHKHVTSFGTLLSKLCHEFCHHLDRERFGFPHTPHTRGFYERTAALYHRARGTPPKLLFWRPQPGGTWVIDWAADESGRVNGLFCGPSGPEAQYSGRHSVYTGERMERWQ